MLDVNSFYINSYEETYKRFPDVVTLPGLQIDHQVPRGVCLKDLGEVFSLKGSLTNELLLIRGMISQNRSLLQKVLDIPEVNAVKRGVEKKFGDIDTTNLGACFHEPLRYSATVAYMMMTKFGLAPNQRIFVQGHESCEYLQKMSHGKDELQAELDRRGIDLNCTGYSGEEFADIGGLLALRKAIDDGITTDIQVPQFRNSRPWLSGLQNSFGF